MQVSLVIGYFHTKDSLTDDSQERTAFLPFFHIDELPVASLVIAFKIPFWYLFPETVVLITLASHV